MISECSKLEQKEYKTIHDWVGQVIYWELCKTIKFDQKKQWYMHNEASVLENDTHTILCDFDIQTDYQISSRRTNLLIINKKQNLQNCRLCYSGWPQKKPKESEKQDKY